MAAGSGVGSRVRVSARTVRNMTVGMAAVLGAGRLDTTAAIRTDGGG